MRIYVPSRMQSAKDAPSQLTMKYRQVTRRWRGLEKQAVAGGPHQHRRRALSCGTVCCPAE